MKKALFFLTILFLLISCKSGDRIKNTEPSGERASGRIVGRFEVDYILPPENLQAVKSLTLRVYNRDDKSSNTVSAQFDRESNSFILIDQHLPEGSYTFKGVDMYIHKEPNSLKVIKLMFTNSFKVKAGVVNNLGKITLKEGELIRSYSIDEAGRNRGYDELYDYYQNSGLNREWAEKKWQNISIEEGERADDWERLSKKLTDKVEHSFEGVDVTISYQAEAGVGENMVFLLTAKSNSSFTLNGPASYPDLEVRSLEHRSKIDLKGRKELKQRLSLTSYKAGEVILYDFTIYRNDEQHKIPPIIINIK